MLPYLLGTLSKNCRSPLPIWTLSFRRKLSSTAFLIHWWVTHSPSIFSATRSLPASRPSRMLLTAQRMSAGAEVGDRLARCSQALSMTVCSSCGLILCSLGEEVRSDWGTGDDQEI